MSSVINGLTWRELRAQLMRSIKNDPKCGKTIVMYDQQQTRGADEPMTQFFMCVRCEFKYKIN